MLFYFSVPINMTPNWEVRSLFSAKSWSIIMTTLTLFRSMHINVIIEGSIFRSIIAQFNYLNSDVVADCNWISFANWTDEYGLILAAMYDHLVRSVTRSWLQKFVITISRRDMVFHCNLDIVILLNGDLKSINVKFDNGFNANGFHDWSFWTLPHPTKGNNHSFHVMFILLSVPVPQ